MAQPGRPTSSHAAGGVVGLVVPAAIAVVLAVAGRRLAAAVVLLAALAVFVAGRRSPRFARAWARVAAAVGRWVGLVVGAVLLGLLGVLVLVPVGLAMRLLRWRPLGRGGGWRPVPAPRLASRPYAAERTPRPAAVRLHGAVTGLAVVVVVAVVGTSAALGLARATGLGDRRLESALARLPGSPIDDPVAPGAVVVPPSSPDGSGTEPPDEDGRGVNAAYNLLAHQDEPWAEAMFAETFSIPTVYDPITTFRHDDHRGELVNVVDGVRASHRQADPGPDPVEIWFFGGSTMFGVGQRDEHTIASEVVRLAEQEGIGVEATNLAESAWTNWQSLAAMGAALAERPTPDLIVFYDGVNEVPSVLFEQGDREVRILFQAEIERVLAEQSAIIGASPPVELPPLGERAEVALASYLEPVEISTRLAEGYGVPIHHLFQPSLYTIELTEADDAVLDLLGLDRAVLDDQQAEVAEVRAGLPDEVVDLGDALDDEPRPVLYDHAHTNESGARAAAAAVWAEIGPQVRALAGGAAP